MLFGTPAAEFPERNPLEGGQKGPGNFGQFKERGLSRGKETVEPGLLQFSGSRRQSLTKKGKKKVQHGAKDASSCPASRETAPARFSMQSVGKKGLRQGRKRKKRQDIWGGRRSRPAGSRPERVTNSGERRRVLVQLLKKIYHCIRQRKKRANGGKSYSIFEVPRSIYRVSMA